jgi:hypothetical protein
LLGKKDEYAGIRHALDVMAITAEAFQRFP